MPETTAEITQDRAKMLLTEIPIDWATCWLNAVARIATPALEYLKKTEKTASRKTESTKHQTNSRETGTPARSTISWGNSFGLYTRMSVPHTTATAERNTSDSPMVTMMIDMIGSPIIGRRIARSMSSASAMEKRIVSRSAPQKGTCICTRKA